MKQLEDTIDYYKTLNRQVKAIRRVLIIAFIKNLFRDKKLMMCKYLLIGFLAVIGGRLIIDIVNHNAALQSLINIYSHRSIPKQDTLYLHDSTKNERAFLAKLANLESGGKYTVVNQYGYMGKYQFSLSTLNSIGLNVSQSIFLENPELQEVAMKMLMKKNKTLLAKYIGKYQHKTIGGIFITESGLIAGAHLGGAGSVIDFVESGGIKDFKDGNSTPISKYLSQLGNYHLSFD